MRRRAKFCSPLSEAPASAARKARSSTPIEATPWPDACACTLQKFSNLDLYFSSCAKNIFAPAAQIYPNLIKPRSTKRAHRQTPFRVHFERRSYPSCIMTCGRRRARLPLDNAIVRTAICAGFHKRAKAALPTRTSCSCRPGRTTCAQKRADEYTMHVQFESPTRSRLRSLMSARIATTPLVRGHWKTREI